MHVPTHILSGWCIGNVFRLTARERLFCMAAATLPDLDGASYAFGKEAYWTYHHVACHNLLFAVVTAAVLAAFSARRAPAFIVYLGLAHVHFVLDYVGSGPGWPIDYGWPLWKSRWVNPDAWEFSGWQNRAAAGGLLLWTVAIAVVRRRTPVEMVSPSLDAKLVRRPPPAGVGFDTVARPRPGVAGGTLASPGSRRD
ncbi:MAG: hypothetical protein JWO31_478 [Phycisphaerales bacterium]|nr:hypothetical protein [Phycisphaerales bacterium]